MTQEPSRRALLLAATEVGAAVWLAAPAAEILAALATGQPAGPSPLTTIEHADLDALTAVIIPSDGSPGAREAQVIRLIERSLVTFAADQQPLFRAGLADLRVRARKRQPKATSFAALSATDQVAIVEALDRSKTPFFEAARTATIMGMFADPRHGGNQGKVGWQLIGFQDRGSWQAPFGDYDKPAG